MQFKINGCIIEVKRAQEISRNCIDHKYIQRGLREKQKNLESLKS